MFFGRAHALIIHLQPAAMRVPVTNCGTPCFSDMPSSHGTPYSSPVLFRFSRFSKPYRARLLAGLKDLCSFCQDTVGCQLGLLARKPRVADKVLSDYVLARHTSQRKLALVKHALLGCQHVFPHLRGKISTAWEHIRVWEEQRITRLRPPLPIPIWLSMVGLARAHAKVDRNERNRRQWEIFSVLLEIGFFCMLRPGELMRLTHADIALPGSFVVCEQHAAIRILSPKNRRQFGESQFVLVKNSNTVAWLTKVLVVGATEPIWFSGVRAFTLLFKQSIKELGVEDCKFTPASLRPGGATMYYSAGVSVPTLRFMGRWSVERSLEHYLQVAMATQIMNKLKPSAVSRLKRLAPLCLQNVLVDQCASPLELKDLLAWCLKYTRKDGQCKA